MLDLLGVDVADNYRHLRAVFVYSGSHIIDKNHFDHCLHLCYPMQVYSRDGFHLSNEICNLARFLFWQIVFFFAKSDPFHQKCYVPGRGVIHRAAHHQAIADLKLWSQFVDDIIERTPAQFGGAVSGHASANIPAAYRDDFYPYFRG